MPSSKDIVGRYLYTGLDSQSDAGELGPKPEQLPDLQAHLNTTNLKNDSNQSLLYQIQSDSRQIPLLRR